MYHGSYNKLMFIKLTLIYCWGFL